MKKIISFVILALCAVCVNAQIANEFEKVYLQDCTVQSGAPAQIKVMVAYDSSRGHGCIGTIQFNYSFPSGIVVEDNNSDVAGVPGVGVPVVNDKTNFVLLGGCEPVTSANQEGAAVIIFNVDIPADLAPGQYEMSLSNIGAYYEDGDGEFNISEATSTLTVQKAAVIEELGDGNFVSIVPAAMKPGFYADGNVTALDIYYTSKTDLAGLSFNLNLPHAEFYSSAFDEGGNPVEAVLNNDVYNNSAKTLSVETVDDQNLKIAYSGFKTTRAANQRYIKATDVPTKLATIYIESEESLPADIYTLTLSDITLEEYVTADTGTLHIGKNYSTIVVGTPEQNEAIIYGYCTSSAASAISTALKNVAIADVTVATVDDDAKFTDVLVNEKGGNSYYTRTSTNYGTTVLPYALTANEALQLYAVKEMNASSITIEEVDEVPANETCIFKGTIDVSGPTPSLGVPSDNNLGSTTFKGTYEATKIADGAGYYISSDGKFYGDGATVRPFRGYFDGAIADVKSFSVKLETANGVIDITNQLSDEAIYSLQGIRTQTAKKGVNIVGGKKVYIK